MRAYIIEYLMRRGGGEDKRNRNKNSKILYQQTHFCTMVGGRVISNM